MFPILYLHALFQSLYRGSQHAVADVDAQRTIQLAAPDVVVVWQGGGELALQNLHLRRSAAVGHRQIVPRRAVVGLRHQLDELADHQVPAPDLGNGLELPVGGEGDEGLDLEHGARHGRHLADAAAFL